MPAGHWRALVSPQLALKLLDALSKLQILFLQLQCAHAKLHYLLLRLQREAFLEQLSYFLVVGDKAHGENMD